MRFASMADMMLSSSSLVKAKNRSISPTFSSCSRSSSAPSPFKISMLDGNWLARYSQRFLSRSISFTSYWLAKMRARRRPTLPPPASIKRCTGLSVLWMPASTMRILLVSASTKTSSPGRMRVSGVASIWVSWRYRATTRISAWGNRSRNSAMVWLTSKLSAAARTTIRLTRPSANSNTCKASGYWMSCSM